MRHTTSTEPRLTIWQAVKQSWIIHPDWDVAMHLSWLENDGFYDLSTLDGDPTELVTRWLRFHEDGEQYGLPIGTVPPTAHVGEPSGTQEERRCTEYVSRSGYRGREVLRVPVDSWFDSAPAREGWEPYFVSVDASRTVAVKVYSYKRAAAA